MKMDPNRLARIIRSSLSPTRISRFLILRLLAAAVVLMTIEACSKRTALNPSSGKPGPGKGAASVPVTVVSARSADVPMQLTGIGTVHAYSTVTVKSRVPGALARVGFKQGDEVHAGELIFLIDPRPYQSALKQSQANLQRDQALLEKAQADFRRDHDLFTNNILSSSDFDQSRASVDSLKATILADEAAVNTSEVQLSFCSIKSPITGRIGTLLVNEGNMVKDIDTVLAVINQVQPIYVDFFIPEQNLPAVREHMKTAKLDVEATIPSFPGHRAEGQLLMINNQVDSTGTVLLRAEFPNADEMLWPGQFVNVALTLAIQHNAVVVPASAVQLGQKSRYLCLVKPDDTVEFRDVEVGGAFGEEDVIQKGLQAGERVITSGQLRLVPGTKVKIVAVTGSDDRPAAK